MWRVSTYRAVYKFHRLVWLLGWCVAGIVVISAVLVFAWMRQDQPFPAWSLLALRGVIWLPVAWLALLVLWLPIAGWHSVVIRYLAWWLSLSVGGARRWLLTGWPGALVLVAAAALARWVYSLFVGPRLNLVDFLSPNLALQVLVIVALLVVLYWASQVRRRITVLGFVDYTNDDKLKPCVDGVAARLQDELARLAALYRSVEETSPFELSAKSTSDSTESAIPPEATVNVADVGQTLQGIVSAESTLSIGLLQIPIGALLGVVGRIVEGPRLVGSLHRAGDQLVLVASLSGGGLHGNWRVSQADLQNGATLAGTGAVDKLIEQMACRVFADLGQQRLGTSSWRAVHNFSEGLRNYRDTLRTQRSRIVKLFEAERAFIRALAEDQRFASCHYNLGVVYRTLRQNDSARAAFTKAAEVNPDLADAYLGLALDAWDHQQNQDVVRYCDQVIQLQPESARAWDLEGLAQRRLSPSDGQAKTIETRSIATALAWRALCRSALSGQGRKPALDTAVECTRSLAIASAVFGRPNSLAIFYQALYLSPTSHDIYFELGKVLEDRKDFFAAAHVFEIALQINERPTYWTRLAVVQANLFSLGRHFQQMPWPERLLWVILRQAPARWLWRAEVDEHAKAASEACRQALDNGWQADDAMFADVRKALQITGALDKANEVRSMRSVHKWLDKLTDADDGNPAFGKLKTRLERKLAIYQYLMNDWAGAQIAIRIGELHLYAQRVSETERGHYQAVAADYLALAINWLKADHLNEIQARGLYGLMARAHVGQNKAADALDHVKKAVALNPERAWERTVLGEVSRALNDYQRAEAELTSAHYLDPGNDYAIQQIAFTYIDRGISLRNPAKRRVEFSKVLEMLEQYLYLIEQPSSLTTVADQTVTRGWAHYWLGRFHGELLDFDAAITHLRIGLAIGYKPLETRLALGWTYWRARAHDLSEKTFREVAVEALKQSRRVKTCNEPADAPGEEQPINEILVQMYLYSALAYAERGINAAQAVRRTRYAVRRLDRMKTSKVESRLEFQSYCYLCAGWNAFRGGRLADATDNLERAVSIMAGFETLADAYDKLAVVYTERARVEPHKKERWLAKAAEAERHLRETDVRGEYIAGPDKGQSTKP